MANAPLKILIADDNASDLKILSALLKREGYEVVCAEDGAMAVRLFESENPDFVLLDVMMPNLDGYEAAKRIKAKSHEKLTPIVFLTAMTDVDALTRCLEVGGDDFLTKPYQKDILRAKMNALIRIRNLYVTVSNQRDKIHQHQLIMEREQRSAKDIFDKIAHKGCLDAHYIKYHLSPTFIFNGDILVAAEKPGGGLQCILGDVTGHGLPAAICAMPVAEQFYDMSSKGFALADILTQINHRLCAILPVGVFCCAIAIEIDARERVMRVWNGGMPAGLVLRKGKGVVSTIESSHLALGIITDDRFRADMATVEIQEGDIVLLYSDGVIEACNEQQEAFGETRLIETVLKHASKENVISALRNQIIEFRASPESVDDASLIQISIDHHLQHISPFESIQKRHVVGPRDFEFQLVLRAQALRESDPLPLLLQAIMDVPDISPFRGQIFTVLAELYSNALEHGLLALNSSLKNSPQGFSEYYRLRQERLSALNEGMITLHLSHTPDNAGGILHIGVSDSGDGFDVSLLNLPKLANNPGYAGRGMALVNQLCESIHYNDKGNEVKAIFRWRNEGIVA